MKEDKISGIIKWENYSSLTKLLRHCAWIIKLKSNWLRARKSEEKEDLTILHPKDLEKASFWLCKLSQEESAATLTQQRLASLRPIKQ